MFALTKRLLTRPAARLRAERLEDRVTPAVVPFGLPTVVGSAPGAYTVVLADLSGDGKADVLTGSYGDGTAAWHQNLGGGSFGPR
jgi:hypothetical protein